MFLTALSALAFALVAPCQTFQSPIRNPGVGPHMVTAGGYYNLSNTQGSFVSVTRSKTIGGLWGGDTRTVWMDNDRSRNSIF